MKEKNIQELAKRMGLVTVEDMCQYTIAQLVVKIANKVNELVNEVWRFESDVQEILKTQNENIQYLLGKGLLLEVESVFDGWVQDGTFDTLLNQSALKKINDRIDETNAQLSTIMTNYRIFTGGSEEEFLLFLSSANTNERIVIQNIIVLTNDLTINHDILFIENGKLVVNECKLIVNGKIENKAMENIFEDASRTKMDYVALTDLIEDEKGIYIYNQEVELDWFYKEDTEYHSLNVATRACLDGVLNASPKTYEIKGESFLPVKFNGNDCTLKFIGNKQDYPNNIVVRVDHKNRFQHEHFGYYLDFSHLEELIEFGIQVGGTQYSKFEKIILGCTANDSEEQKIRFGLLVKPLNPKSKDIDHAIFNRFRISNAGVLVTTNDDIERGNITELYFNDCAFGNNGNGYDAPITIEKTPKKHLFSVRFNGGILSQPLSGRAVRIVGGRDCTFTNLTQEYYRGTRTNDANSAYYTIDIEHSEAVVFKNVRFGDLTSNNFIKLTNTHRSVFDSFDVYVIDSANEIATWGNFIVINTDGISSGNTFSNTYQMRVNKNGTEQWNELEEGSFFDLMTSKIIGDISGNTFDKFFGVSDAQPYYETSESFSLFTHGANVTIDKEQKKIIFNRSATNNPEESWVKIKVPTKVTTILMNAIVTDSELNSSEVYILAPGTKPQKMIRHLNKQSWIRVPIYSENKEVLFKLYNPYGTSTCTMFINEIKFFNHLGATLE